ncbi:Lysine-specific demethylase 7A, variant 2 [Chamberlinius hualienensis]
MSTSPVYCLCGKPYDPTKFMIQCDACKEWFHGSCVGLHEHQSNDIEKYHCPKCEKMFGPSISKRRTNWHRQDYSDPDAEGKPVQTGTPVFIKELKSRHFPSADEVLLVQRGQQLTLPALTQNGFTKPILVENTDGLGLVVPPSTFTVEDVEKYLGPEFEIDAIDVTRQDDIHMAFTEFVRYFNSPVRTKIINLISLEFSNSRLSPLVEAPYIVNKLSWIQNIWPDKLPENCVFSKPFVQKYCLVGVRDSYTDFHIDFGGTSVWYHVLRGEKVFYLIRPSQANLALYKRWMASSNRSETFFGDQVDACFKCTVKQGQTLFIPTAWIHAVFTPVDSLVFGGNFLHSLNLPLQLQVYDIEKRIKTPDKFRFPWFETVNWYAAKHILDEIKDQNGSDRKPLPYLIQGAKALVSALRSWTQDKDYLKNHKDEIPQNISYLKLIKDLTKEVRNAEKSTQNKKPKLRQLPPRDRRGKVRLRLGVNLEYPQLNDESVLNNSTNLNNSNNIPTSVTATKSNVLPDDFEVAYEQSLIKMISEHDTKGKDGNHCDSYAIQPKEQDVRVTVKVKPPIAPATNANISVQSKIDESVYEFHDSDEDQLVVDENPRRSTIRKPASKKIIDYGRKQTPIKMKFPTVETLKKSHVKQGNEGSSSLASGVIHVTNGRNAEYKELKIDVSQSSTAKSENKDDDVLASPKLGGIEELLRASGYASEGAKRISKLNLNQKPDAGEAEHLLVLCCALLINTLILF